MSHAFANSLFAAATVVLLVASFGLAFAGFSALAAPAETFPNDETLSSFLRLALIALTIAPLVVVLFAAVTWAKLQGQPRLFSFLPLAAPFVYVGASISIISVVDARRAPDIAVSAPASDEALAAWLAERPGVKEVAIRDSGLVAVPARLLSSTSLEVIDLAGNRIATLPDALGRLPRLRVLYLNGNPIAQEEIARWIAGSGYKGAVNQ